MSTTIRRALRAGAVATAAVICGATTAQAYTFASEGAPLSVRDEGTLRGQSYGHLSRRGSNALVLDTRARDLVKKDGRAYSQGNAYRGQDAVRIQTGRRSDGGTFFAP
ncbi:hypothetical protein GCM10025868_35430 [Angustibacter aerolatus]|uniref:Uncharacterized protein n=1 Tax=Angustibacter aerolatus TaxID=1162965 RepID=A0ABQ6JLL9_9ACTN|nr:hypothetical protein [Angustibacter aerolatus]GMA88293.1 hypothetical protein GCM10025868_35430 [Angustibacter aerolatus]